LSSVAKGACDCESKIREQKAMLGKDVRERKAICKRRRGDSTSLPLVGDNAAVDGADSFLFKSILKP